MKKTLLSALVLIQFVSFAYAEVQITGFGTDDSFVDFGSPGFSQTATTASFSGLDNALTWGGTFDLVDASGQTSFIKVTGTVTGTNPGSDLLFQLWDGDKFAQYTGNWASFGSGSEISVTLAQTSVDSGFNASTIQGFTVNFGGTGSSLTVTFNNLSALAIPEPSTWAPLLGGAALAMAAGRRRKRKFVATA